jgi:hypothetical protein
MMMMVVAMEHVQCLSVRHNNNLIVALSTHSFPHFSFCGYGVDKQWTDIWMSIGYQF